MITQQDAMKLALDAFEFIQKCHGVAALDPIGLRENVETLKSALAQQGEQPVDGWMLVPVEPTQAMCAAAVKFVNGDAVYKNVAAEALEIEEGIYGEAYRAMLAAAPVPQAQPLTDEIHRMLVEALELEQQTRNLLIQILHALKGG